MEYRRYEPGRSISYTITTDPAKNSGQPAHPRSLIKVFVGQSAGSQGSNASSGGQRRLRSACATAQADLRWAHMQSCRKCSDSYVTNNCPKRKGVLQAYADNDCPDRIQVGATLSNS